LIAVFCGNRIITTAKFKIFNKLFKGAQNTDAKTKTWSQAHEAKRISKEIERFGRELTATESDSAPAAHHESQ